MPVKAQYTVLHNFFAPPFDGENPWGDLTLSGKTLYGMTSEGGTNNTFNSGCIFSIDTNGNNYKILLDFNDTNGGYPLGSLTLSGSRLYGMTSNGGVSGFGNIFSIDTDGSGFKNLLYFNGTNGKSPNGSLIISGSQLFGMTYAGGIHDSGVIFSIDTNGNNYKKLLDFTKSKGIWPHGSLIFEGTVLYGMTAEGGVNNEGCIFSIDTNGNNYKKLLDFNFINGKYSTGSLIYSSGILYGMAQDGGANSEGCIFSIDTNGSGYKDLYDFTANRYILGAPRGSLTISGSLLYGMTPGEIGGLGLNGCIFSINTNGSGFKNMFDFNESGANPWGSLTYASGELYGMTYNGGANQNGVVFKIDTDAVSTASLNNIHEGSGLINVYPNPNNGKFTLSPSNVNAACNVEIYNILGENIYQSRLNANSTEINLSGQPEGIYLYRVISENGNLIGEGKIIIQQ